METTYKPTYEQLEEALAYLTGDVICGGYLPRHVLCGVQDKVDAILNPPPTYKEVTVERWECNKCGHLYKNIPPMIGEVCGNGCDSLAFTKLTGTRRVPVKQPVRKTTTGMMSIGGGMTFDGPCQLPPEGTRFKLEWEE